MICVSSAAYSASKAAVISLARSDAIDVSFLGLRGFFVADLRADISIVQYSPDLIRVNCVCPGLVA